MTRAWPWIRALAAVALLGVVVWRLGTGPFWAGVRSLRPGLLATALAIGVLTTTCAAARWRTVAGGLGIGLPLRSAVGACYRSQFLNSVLPGGVVGDVDRGIRHGRETAAVGRGLRAVGWERAAGQVVQIAVTAMVLAVTPGPLRSALPLLLASLALLAAVGLVIVRLRLGGGGAARVRLAVIGDVATGLLNGRRWPVVVLTSMTAVGGYAGTFVLAARAVGLDAPIGRLLPVALVILVAMGIPIGIGGWGLREGAAAWAFAASGWSATQGVAAATAYGVMSLVVALPGAVLLCAGARRPRGRRNSAGGDQAGDPAGDPTASPTEDAPGAATGRHPARGVARV